MKFSTIINGIDVNASFSESNIQDLFFPLLQHLSALHSEKQRRILVMLAAPPGAGKSTLVSFLEHLAADAVPGKSVQAIGMDGFHRRQEYLLMHTASVDGKDLPLFRADWIFRGAVLPAGEHDIVMRFDPKVYPVSENVSKASSIALLLLVVLALAGVVVFREKENKNKERVI